MSETHVINVEKTDRQQWRWVCSCGEKPDYKYPNERNAFNAGAVHRALRTVLR